MQRMIPAAKLCAHAEIVGIASRDGEKARAAAERLGIPRAYGSYEELLADRDIDAIYIPLPNHLHVPWSIRAAEAGKHVLCEKPIAISSAGVEELIRIRDSTGMKIGEAFMVHTHPRWVRTRELIANGRIGALRSVTGYFSIPLTDTANVRYNAEWGGGVLFDLGCYQVYIARTLFGEEPHQVVALSDRHPETGVDRLTSMLLDFRAGQCCFNCSFETAWGQRMELIGTKARMILENAVGAPDSRATRLVIDDGSNPFGESAMVEEFAACNQFAVELDAFSQAILDGAPQPVPLEDSLRNARVLEAVALSAKTLKWVRV